MRALIAALLLSGCTHALTDDAVLLVSRDSDLDYAEAGFEQFQDHVGVRLTATRDAKVFAGWGTEEKWRLEAVADGTEVTGDDGAIVPLCKPEADGTVTFGVTRYSDRRVFVADCARDDARVFVIAHEQGHLAGATDCNDGVMSGNMNFRTMKNVTLEPGGFTVRELEDLYGIE